MENNELNLPTSKWATETNTNNMKVETKWLIDYYQQELDKAENGYKIDYFRGIIDKLRNGYEMTWTKSANYEVEATRTYTESNRT